MGMDIKKRHGWLMIAGAAVLCTFLFLTKAVSTMCPVHAYMPLAIVDTGLARYQT